MQDKKLGTCVILASGLAVAAGPVLGCAPDLGVAPRGDEAQEGGTPVWSRSFGGAGDQAAVAVSANTAGDLVVVGQLGGKADFGQTALESAGSDDVFIAWLDAAGEVTNALRLGDANPQEVHAIAPTGDSGVLLAGAMSGALDLGSQTLTSAGGRDGYVAKLGAEGETGWGWRFGDAGYQAATSVTVDVAGNVFVAGLFSGAAAWGGEPVESRGGYDVLLAKLGPDGTPLWARGFGDARDQRAWGIASDGVGGSIVVGEFAGNLSFGTSTLASAGAEDIFVAQIGAGGDVLWARRFGDATAQVGRRIAVDREGNLLVGGEFTGSLDLGGGPLAGAGVGGLFIGKLDSKGQHLWSKGFPGSGPSRVEGLAVSVQGDVVITGVLAGSLEVGGDVLVSQGEDDVFVAKLDVNGELQWVQRFGGVGAQSGLGLAMDADGNTVVAGTFKGALEIGGTPLESMGSSDALVVKLSP